MYGLPSWLMANATALPAAPEGGAGPSPAAGPGGRPGRPFGGQAAEQGPAAQGLLAAPLLGHGPPDLPGQAVVVAALGGQAGLEALLALGLVGQLGREGLDLAAQLLDPVDGRAVGPDHLLLVLGGDQGLVDAVGAQQLAEGRGGPAGVDRPEPLAELAPGRAQAAGGQDLLAGPGLLGPGAGQGLADLVVVLDQALDLRNRQELWIGGAGMITRRPPQRR
jgi:hypothetical protein